MDVNTSSNANRQKAAMDEMQEHLPYLDRLLLQEIDAYQQLLALQRAEKHLLTSQTLEPFVVNLQAKEHLTAKIAIIEEKRQTALAQLAPRLHFCPATVTLKQLSAEVDEPFASAFLRHRKRLQQLVGQLQQSNHENAELLQDALAFIEGALVLFAHLMPAKPTYHASGKFTASKQGRLLSGKV